MDRDLDPPASIRAVPAHDLERNQISVRDDELRARERAHDAGSDSDGADVAHLVLELDEVADLNRAFEDEDQA